MTMITTKEHTYGWDLTCDVCKGTIPEGTEAWITETPSGDYISARHVECEDGPR
jgi:hypothetical protein